MKKIYEYEGKKYNLVMGEGSICSGCCFKSKAGECSVGGLHEINCIDTSNYYNLFHYIFKELKPEEGNP